MIRLKICFVSTTIVEHFERYRFSLADISVFSARTTIFSTRFIDRKMKYKGMHVARISIAIYKSWAAVGDKRRLVVRGNRARRDRYHWKFLTPF